MTSLHDGFWPVASFGAAQLKDRFPGQSGLGIDGFVRSLLTHCDISRPPIAVLHNASSVVGYVLG
jgi:hypothetical protein